MKPIRKTHRNRIEGAIYGAILGDAMGVPVEFRSRRELTRDPVIGFESGGTHGQPRYAWSDDSALMLAQMDSLVKKKKVNYADQAVRFLQWRDDAKYTSHGRVFDIGGATSASLERLRYLKDPTRAGSANVLCSGNGALMRILPLCIWLAEHEPDLDKALKVVEKCSSMTHRSKISIRCCQFYSLVVRGILTGGCVGYGMLLARENMKQRKIFDLLFNETRLWGFQKLRIGDIRSSGYVVDTLEAALFCVQQNKSDVMESILAAVNLGGDTDTTACVAGGLAGLSRGLHNIPDCHILAIEKHRKIKQIISSFVDLSEG